MNAFFRNRLQETGYRLRRGADFFASACTLFPASCSLRTLQKQVTGNRLQVKTRRGFLRVRLHPVSCLLFFLAVSCGIGCSQFLPQPELISPSAPCSFEAASARWKAATGLEAIPDRVIYSPNRHVPCPGKTGRFLGCYWSASRVVLLGAGPLCQRTAAHEAGHVMGAYGHHEGVGLMVPNLSNPNARDIITRDDLNYVCLYAECLWKRPESEESVVP